MAGFLEPDRSLSLISWEGPGSRPIEGPGHRVAVLESPRRGKAVPQEPGWGSLEAGSCPPSH